MNARAHAAGISTVADRLDRAIVLGRELRDIHADPGLHALSLKAWRAACYRLAGVPGEPELRGIEHRIQTLCPALAAEVEIRGKLWAQYAQDRPAVFRFRDPDRWPAVYAEALTAKITDEQASAISAWRCAELRLARSEGGHGEFGQLDDFADLQAMLDPRQIELHQLDLELTRMVLLPMLHWSASGPVLRHAGLELAVDATTFDHLASGLADLVQRQPAQLPAAA